MFLKNSKNKFNAILFTIVLGCLIGLVFFVQLESIPTLWWDEGWTLILARNWVQQGFYGQIMDGQRLSPGLAGHFPVIASEALSFKIFGVGVWQGRLPFVLFGIIVLVLMFVTARILYNTSIAWGTLFLLIFTSMTTGLNPIIMGRQILGEILALIFLLSGFLCYRLALSKNYWWSQMAVLCWGMALVTKSQVLPFWLASMGLMLLGAGLKRWWRQKWCRHLHFEQRYWAGYYTDLAYAKLT